MSYTDWKDKTSDFKKIDVRGIQGNFFQGIKKHATLFAAYKTIKNMERKGNSREEIAAVLMEKYGEKNPDVKVM